MLLNKIFLVILTSFIVVSCNSKKEDSTANNQSNNTQSKSLELNNPDSLKSYIKIALEASPSFIFPGNFDDGTNIISYVTGTETNNKNESGIKFSLLKQKENKLVIDFQTVLLKGSFTKSAQRQFRPKGFNYDLIYYTSLNYFMGTKFGEIFSYIIDFRLKQVYYSHLFTTNGNSFSIFISPNVTDKTIKHYLITPFSKDFSSAIEVKKDVDLDNL